MDIHISFLNYLKRNNITKFADWDEKDLVWRKPKSSDWWWVLKMLYAEYDPDKILTRRLTHTNAYLHVCTDCVVKANFKNIQKIRCYRFTAKGKPEHYSIRFFIEILNKLDAFNYLERYLYVHLMGSGTGSGPLEQLNIARYFSYKRSNKYVLCRNYALQKVDGEIVVKKYTNHKTNMRFFLAPAISKEYIETKPKIHEYLVELMKGIDNASIFIKYLVSVYYDKCKHALAINCKGETKSIIMSIISSLFGVFMEPRFYFNIGSDDGKMVGMVDTDNLHRLSFARAYTQSIINIGNNIKKLYEKINQRYGVNRRYIFINLIGEEAKDPLGPIPPFLFDNIIYNIAMLKNA